MKVLSLKQPYAELIVSGKKTIEIRTWNTNFRGEFYIHASQNPYTKGMKDFGYESLPTGCIVGKATLDYVKKYSSKEDFEKDKNKHLASSEFGSYGFVLKDAQRIEEIPAKGKLGFWEFNK